MDTETETDTVYVLPYAIRTPRGRPTQETAPVKSASKQAPKPQGSPRRVVPLTPEEIAECRSRYKDNELKQEYACCYKQYSDQWP